MTNHNHYFKDVSQLSVIDVYRTLILFAVTDPCIQHAVKKLLVAGGRGAGKDISQDIQEAIDSLERWKEMRQEENPIYNRRAEDQIQEVDDYPEVWPDDSVDHPEDKERYRTTGKFKAGDTVSIHDVGGVCIPEEFEGAVGEVLYENGCDYSVKFNLEFNDNPEPVWCVWEHQMQLVEEAHTQFKDGDEVRVIKVPQCVPEDTYNLEGTITKTYHQGEDSEHFRVEFPELDNNYWYFNADEIEHV